MRKLFCLVALSSVFAAGCVEEEEPTTPPNPVEDSIRVTVVGTLQTGIVAIGGEATGTIITSKEVTWELDLSPNPEWQQLAEELDGKKVLVKGELNRVEGVEIPLRWIVTVSSLEAAE